MQLPKFTDALPIPPVLKPKDSKAGVPYYTVKMKEFQQKLHRDLPTTTLWGYEGIYPGPTIKVHRGEKIKVKWENNLPVNHHLLPLDTTIHGSGSPNPAVRTVVHVHGAKVDYKSDGYPEAWYTNSFGQVGPHFRREVYEYTNDQQATTLWYHDHAMGITRLNVYAGLAGFYLIHDAREEALNLPGGKYDIPLLIQDKSFNEDGSLFYPSGPAAPGPDIPNPSIVPAFFGDSILVNGKVWPYLEVEPRKYRFRLLNGSNDRTYNIKLDGGQDGTVPSWFQIATDGGLIEKPVTLSQLIISPAERAEVIIDFSGFEDRNIIFTNTQPPVDPETTGQIIQFRVGSSLSQPDTSVIPSFMSPFYPIPERYADKTRDMTIVVSPDKYGRPMFMLNGMMWDDPVTEKPVLDSVEIWRIINSGLGTHPIHLHLVQFNILDRQPFDVAQYNSTGNIIFTGPAVPPDPNEIGWKDTVRANAGFVTRIIARFEDFTGLYVWHCHILEHEDYDMMRPLKVVKWACGPNIQNPAVNHGTGAHMEH